VHLLVCAAPADGLLRPIEVVHAVNLGHRMQNDCMV
jgi:hypothetical protein